MNKLPQTSLTRANAAFRNKDFETALVLYEEALCQAKEPLKAYIRFNRALTFRRLNISLASAINTLEKPESLNEYHFNLIKQGAFFDPVWYVAQYQKKYNVIDNPLSHYLAHGVELSTNPSPQFDTAYYIKTHKDVVKSGMHPFLHYVYQGHKENRACLPSSPSEYESKYSVAESEYIPRLPTETPPVEKVVRVIAFYLPQFHAIPENDEWWGKGFTEWTNVKPATPQFEGHYQPHIPDNFLGYYDLHNTAVMHKQIELAKQYGVEGFCFYTYWFSGKRLLETPVDNYLSDPSLDLPFCICWANENWSRRWDGLDSELLIQQHYSPEDDINFIANTAKYLRDPRYIRINNKPILLVYRPNLLPNIKETVLRWRTWCRDNGIGEICLTYPQSFACVAPEEYGFDAACEFPPNNSAPPQISHKIRPLAENFQSIVYDWRAFVDRSEAYEDPGYTLFRCTTPSWDNTARKKNKGTILHNNCPRLFEKWLTNAFIDTLQRHKTPDEQIVFINAWNEWAEGAHLEPDQRYGYAWLTALRQAHKNTLFKRRRIVVVSHDAHPHGAQILCLNFARYFKKQFNFDVDLIVLGEGCLIPKYTHYAQVHKLDLAAASKPEIEELISRLRVKGAEVAIVNTTVSAKLIPYLKNAGFSVVSLVHEMPGILDTYGLQEHARCIAEKADRVVFPAEQVKNGFEEFIGHALEKAVIRPQGLYLRSLLRTGANKNAIRAEVRSELGLSAQAKIIMCAGYADHRKGFDLFVQSCIKVMEEIPDTYALWVGHLDQEFVDRSMCAAKISGHEHKFLFTGLVEHPQKYYLAADIYALTSREDPFPSVVMEALDALTPVVAFENCGGFENLLKRDCGILVPSKNTSAYAQAMITLLNYPTEALRLASNGQQIVESELSFSHYLFDLLQLAGHALQKVSVVVPNYNYERYIRQRLETIIKQTYPIYELIVLDDASSDKSVDTIMNFIKTSELSCHLAINEKNSGSVFKQWHKGIQLARGDLVWIAEADDICKPQFLQRVAEGMEKTGAILGFTDSWQIDEDGNYLGDSYKLYVNEDAPGAFDHSFVMEGREFLANYLGIKNVILNVSGVVFRRDALLAALDRVGSELLDYKVAGDWRLYIELCASNYKVLFEAEPLNGHRRHQLSVTQALVAERHIAEIKKMHVLANEILSNESLFTVQSNHVNNTKLHLGMP